MVARDVVGVGTVVATTLRGEHRARRHGAAVTLGPS